jgi:ParB family chromosome partitioning protein
MVAQINAGEVVKSGKRTLQDKKVLLPEEFKVLKTKLSDFFKTKVQMTCSQQGKGKISIPFDNEEELTRIIELFDRMKG